MKSTNANAKADKEKARLLTPEFRVSYPHVFKANSIKGSKPKFSVTMLFPKDSDLSPIKEAIKQAKIVAFGPNKDNWPEDLESPVTDGDKPKFADKAGYAGHWAIKASTNEDQRPGVVDANVQPITDPSEFYPGCYARASVYAYVWSFGGKQGISFILDHIQKLRDGKSFGGKKSADQVFTPVSSGRDDGETDGGINETEDDEDFT